MASATAPARDVLAVRRAIERHSFCTLATSSPANEPHVVGVVYVAVDGFLYISTTDGSRKVRNLRQNPRAAVCIPVRRFPIGPPFCVQFQGTAEVLSRRQGAIAGLLDAGRLKKIVGHGVLEDPRTCFLRLTPDRKVFTYGLGVSLRSLLRDPVNAGRTVEIR